MPNSSVVMATEYPLDEQQQTAFVTNQHWRSLPLANTTMIGTCKQSHQQAIGYEMKLNNDGHFYQQHMDELRSEFTAQGDSIYYGQQVVGTSSAAMPSSSLEKFMAQQPQSTHQQQVESIIRLSFNDNDKFIVS